MSSNVVARILARIANNDPNSQIDDLLLRAYPKSDRDRNFTRASQDIERGSIQKNKPAILEIDQAPLMPCQAMRPVLQRSEKVASNERYWPIYLLMRRHVEFIGDIAKLVATEEQCRPRRDRFQIAH
jgi:hypothetical protein